MQFQLADLWETLTDAGPDAECLAAGPVHHTRRSLDDRASQVAHLLRSRGVRPGDTVGICSHNRAEYLEAMFGCWKIAAVPVNLNYRYVADELRYVIADAGLVAMLAERTFVPLLDELAPEFPGLHTYVLLEDGTDHQPHAFAALDWAAALVDQPVHREFGVERSADDLYLLYTGGTTGMPKGVMWRHEDIFFASFGGGNYYDPIRRPEDIAGNADEPGLPMYPLAIAPLMHGGGQWITFIGLYSGGKSTVYCERSFDPMAVLELAAAESVATIAIVGDAMGRPLAETAVAAGVSLPSLVTIGNGGAALTDAVKDQLRDAFPGILITDGFGATETGAAGAGADESPDDRGRRFKIDENTAVLDPDTLDPIEPGSGRRGLLARSGHIPLGYHNDPDKTEATFRVDRNGRRWVVPGDWALRDDDGTLVLLGRGSQSINTGGEKVYPEEVEAAVRSHPDVYDALVVGVPDERWGETVVALVQPRPGCTGLDLSDVQDHCRARIAGYKVPRHLVLGPVQRTTVGKPDYVWARRQALAALGLDA